MPKDRQKYVRYRTPQSGGQIDSKKRANRNKHKFCLLWLYALFCAFKLISQLVVDNLKVAARLGKAQTLAASVVASASSVGGGGIAASAPSGSADLKHLASTPLSTRCVLCQRLVSALWLPCGLWGNAAGARRSHGQETCVQDTCVCCMYLWRSVHECKQACMCACVHACTMLCQSGGDLWHTLPCRCGGHGQAHSHARIAHARTTGYIIMMRQYMEMERRPNSWTFRHQLKRWRASPYFSTWH